MGVAVLMPVLNGARHLEAQLDSLALQTCLPSVLIASDDGSDDGTGAVLREFARRAPFEVICKQGPRRGYAANVLALLDRAPDGAIAFCDQDDIWTPNRLARGVGELGRRHDPALHVVERRAFGQGLVGGDRKIAPLRDLFATALIQNIAPANATLLNSAAADLARHQAKRLTSPPPFPDWWIFGLVSGVGGRVIRDPCPGVLYRETGRNMLGNVRSPAGMRRRLRYLRNGSFGRWLRQNTGALQQAGPCMTPEARTRLARFAKALEDGRTADWLALSDRRGHCEKMLLKVVAGFGLI